MKLADTCQYFLFVKYNINSSKYFKTIWKWQLNANTNLLLDIMASTTVHTLQQLKNPAYGRHQLSWPMRIVGPIQIWRGCGIYWFFSLIVPIADAGGGEGLTNDRPRTDHVITGPKIAWEGDKQVNNDNDNTRTSRLLDQLGQEGRVGENWQLNDRQNSFLYSMSSTAVHTMQEMETANLMPITICICLIWHPPQDILYDNCS